MGRRENISKKNSYELSDSQVDTPIEIVKLFWSIVKTYRKEKINNVIDFGSADCRFSQSEHFNYYLGVELDKSRIVIPHDERVEVVNKCAFEVGYNGFDACIGNPPYVRHHDLEGIWKDSTARWLQKKLDYKINQHCNLFAYFIALGILKTNSNGLIAQIVPYEWVSRPSYKSLRDLIIGHKWLVDVYCFTYPIFEKVMTTACLTVIDKSKTNGEWNYFNIDQNNDIFIRDGVCDSGLKILDYVKSDETFLTVRRGISPGSQKIFTLTESERERHKLLRSDVIPCVTSLKHLPYELEVLDEENFIKHFVKANKRCWLIKSNEGLLSPQLEKYLQSIPEVIRSNYTCSNQFPWYNFEKYRIGDILIASAFKSNGPKVLNNLYGVVSVSSVISINLDKSFDKLELLSYLKKFNFEQRMVAHSNNLKRLEIRQLIGVINEWMNANEAS